MSNDPITQILNEVLQGLVTQLNGEIPGAISGAGYDPYRNVASGSASIGVGTASYAVENLTGLSSLRLQDMVVSNVSGSGSSLSGNLSFHAALGSSLSAQARGSVSILFVDPSISGNLRIDGATIAGNAQFHASTAGGKLCLDAISAMDADFNYSNAAIWINDLGPLNYLLQPVENLILDAAKGAIRNLISSQINDIVSEQLNKLLPRCMPLA